MTILSRIQFAVYIHPCTVAPWVTAAVSDSASMYTSITWLQHALCDGGRSGTGSKARATGWWPPVAHTTRCSLGWTAQGDWGSSTIVWWGISRVLIRRGVGNRDDCFKCWKSLLIIIQHMKRIPTHTCIYRASCWCWVTGYHISRSWTCNWCTCVSAGVRWVQRTKSKSGIMFCKCAMIAQYWNTSIRSHPIPWRSRPSHVNTDWCIHCQTDVT